MFKKAIFVAGLAIGFVAGSAAGREPFDQIKSQVLGVTNDPEVRRKVSEGAEKAKATVQEQAPVVAEKAKETASNAADKAKGSSQGDTTGNLTASTNSPETKHI
ncbi:hypothetical protein C884_00478 [Kocuria palustris PEL]|uniref:YtxH domain-containing protein n=1 Tax=Kocuria palustris PEL TaxID=1236550 RepID=M2XBQ9_9MICC|nr:hypothetical protein [Kocuria palustris]EME36491.1 hypothetical protein C884_00478 [Kocuria palustris PEL]